jgi:hypothetical protein
MGHANQLGHAWIEKERIYRRLQGIRPWYDKMVTVDLTPPPGVLETT